MNDTGLEHVTEEIATSPHPSTWRLEIQDEQTGWTVPLGERLLRIGSSRRSNIVIADPTVSGEHLEVSVLGNGVHVKDLESRNGTFVGGARVREAWGGSGTVVNIGCTSIVVRPGLDAVEEADPKPLPGIIGASNAMQIVAAKVRRFAGRRAPVLVLGESGTGKELV